MSAVRYRSRGVRHVSAALMVALAALGCGGQSPVAPTPPPSAPASPASPAAPIGWTTVFSDEFDVPGAPDASKWGYEIGAVRNSEAQYYTSNGSNAFVSGGALIIEARKERVGRYQYTSASLTTQRAFQFTYGRVEIRAKVPAGVGTWPALWTLGTSAPWPAGGEIDIMEHLGFDPPTIYGSIHSAAANVTTPTTVADAETAFHVYAMEWDAKQITLSVDGTSYFTYANPGTGSAGWPFDKPEYLLLNLAIGGEWGGQQGIDDSIFPCDLVIDYVRVLQHS